MTQRLRRVYRTIEIPRDLDTDPERRADLAILNAREEMTNYVMPAQWRVVWDRGDYVRVVRESAPIDKPRRPEPDIELARGPFGTYLIKHILTGRDILVQTDWDYPGLARSFGWTMRPRRLPDEKTMYPEQRPGETRPRYWHRAYCHHDNTDGTVTCEQCGRTATEFITEAREWLDNHIGRRAQDPGYFTEETDHDAS